MQLRSAIAFLLQFYMLLLIARIVLDYIRLFARSWQPRGLVLLFSETVFTLTDPPLRFVRKYVPPLRLGTVAVDLSFLVVFFAISTLSRFF